jgi:hypothetical protein
VNIGACIYCNFFRAYYSFPRPDIVEDELEEREGRDENPDSCSSDDSTWNMELPNVTDLSLDSSTEVPGTKNYMLQFEDI